MITSAHNPKIQQVRQLQARSRLRREAGAFVVEGVRLVEEALQAGWQAQLVLYTREVGGRGMQAVDAFRQRGVPVELVAEHVFRQVSDTQTPQGILAVLAMQALPVPMRPTFVLIADGLREPGNLGTMLRTAAAAGVEAVLLPGETVDAFSPKVLRAGMGAHFKVPLLEQTWEQIEALATVGLVAGGGPK